MIERIAAGTGRAVEHDVALEALSVQDHVLLMLAASGVPVLSLRELRIVGRRFAGACVGGASRVCRALPIPATAPPPQR
jgi:hypothetical protein